MSEQNVSAFDLQLDEMVTAKLRDAAKWSHYLVVVLYIGIVGMIIGIASLLMAGSAFEQSFAEGLSSTPYANLLAFASVTFIVAFMAIALLLMVVLVYVIGKFSGKVKLGLQLNNQNIVAEGMRGLKNYFTISAIMGILSLAFTLLQVITIF